MHNTPIRVKKIHQVNKQTKKSNTGVPFHGRKNKLQNMFKLCNFDKFCTKRTYFVVSKRLINKNWSPGTSLFNHYHLIECNLFSPWFGWKNDNLALNNKCSRALYICLFTQCNYSYLKTLFHLNWTFLAPTVNCLLKNWQSRYNWNIVESGVKHHMIDDNKYKTK